MKDVKSQLYYLYLFRLFIRTLRTVNPSLLRNINIPQILRNPNNSDDILDIDDLESYPTTYLRFINNSIKTVMTQLSDIKITE